MTCEPPAEAGVPASLVDPDGIRQRRIVLVGPMAAGKTTLGLQLADRLGFTFADSDREIVERAGVDIATIFDFEGEDGFRQREHRILDELTQGDDIVVATGGGAVLRADNRELLRARSVVVFLAIGVDEQLRRTRRDRSRPLLQAADRRARLHQLARERDPLYRSVAHVTVQTDGRRSRQTLDRLLEALPAELR